MSKSTGTDFWNRRARKYAARPIKDTETYEHTLARSRAWLNKDDVVLELGCGTGSTAIRLAPFVKSITGADTSVEMIAIANEKLADGGPENASFVTAEAQDARFGPADFDAVLAFNLLHLVTDLESTLARIHDLLKPGGMLIAKTPCVGETGKALRVLVRAMRAIGMAPDVNFFTGKELAEAISGAGFTIEEAGLHGTSKAHNLFIAARRA